MMLFAYAKLRPGNFKGAAVFDSEDTDVYVKAAYLSQFPGARRGFTYHDPSP